MFIENNSNEITPVNSSKTAAVKKVEPVQVTNSLPDGGKELPSRGNNSHGSKENVDDAVREINEHMQVIQRELQFTVDKESGETVIKVIDSKTKELIRQIPGEEALSVAQKISDGANIEIFNSYT